MGTVSLSEGENLSKDTLSGQRDKGHHGGRGHDKKEIRHTSYARGEKNEPKHQRCAKIVVQKNGPTEKTTDAEQKRKKTWA